MHMTGEYQGLKLSGMTPDLLYRCKLIDGLCQAIEDRFSLLDSSTVINATQVLDTTMWPVASDEFEGQ
ncbi:hypothetical protein DPMN_063300 [Dreissena polymorpha]|uniref:Uncharacterized protein n=1 Tax=Dreissena polymorpha TaxID=45954 RepID=A0A9D4CA94_DREPO|nr:hypothetical protein DPMN_063300 [Dreissena polymorpha]